MSEGKLGGWSDAGVEGGEWGRGREHVEMG